MPDINTPNYPVTESPKLSPNPKLTTSYEDGGRGTPTIVVTEAKEQVDTTGVSLPEYTGDYEITENGTLETAGKALKEDIVVAIPEYDGSYSVTENGTLPTEGKVMTGDLSVNVTMPEYEGEYTVTQNGTLPTAGKAMTRDLVVSVQATGDLLVEMWEAYKAQNTMSWSYAFYATSGYTPYFRTVFSYIDNLNNFDFSGSEKITGMSNMFSSCSSLTSVPLFNTSNVTSMKEMFSSCSSLTSVPLFNTSKVTSMGSMFSSCSRLTSVPLFNTSKVTDTSYMFYRCTSLTSVPALNVSNVTFMSGMFDSCSNLEEIHMYGMKGNFDISSSTKFTREALLEIINNCADLTGGKAHTLTMGSTNLAKLTEEDKLIATNNNWTLA